MPSADSVRSSLASRLLWFAGIWVASVIALAVVAFVPKLMIRG